MNRQLIFDETVKHARHQGCKATRLSGGSCAYRAPNGNRCFIGAHIPDSIYVPKMEGLDVHSILTSFPAVCEYFGITEQELISHNILSDKYLLQSLQRIHDLHAPTYWEEQFKNVAAQFGLTYTPPLPVQPESARADDVELAPAV